MFGSIWFRMNLAVAALLTLLCLPRPAEAQIRFDLPAQPLATSLSAVGNMASLNVLFDSRQVEGRIAPALQADLGVDEALARLLAGTGLQAVRVDKNTFSVFSEKETKRSVGRSDSTSETQERLKTLRPGYLDTSYETTRGAADGPRSDGSGENHEGEGRPRNDIQEVVVSAQKRSELLQDVPVPVTAIKADALIESNQLRLQDYYVSVPGLSVMPTAAGVQNLSIRGITTGAATNPTVGITVDDVPYGSSTGAGGAGDVPDFDPSDLARVEVLRGPQGTLYGASSMGGLIKYVTLDPSTDAISGRAQAGISDVHNGAQLGYNVRGSINVPLTSTLAVRASAFTRIDPGYIDNPVLGIDGINRDRVSGGRVAALWKPSEAFTVKLSALYQDYKGDGNSDVDVPTDGYPITTGLKDLQQNYIRGVGAFDRKFEAFSATVTAQLSGIQITSITGYNANLSTGSIDASDSLGTFALQFYGVNGSAILTDSSTYKFTQELRFSIPIGEKIDWLIGGYYTREHSPGFQPYFAEDVDTGALVGKLADYDTTDDVKEYAAFTDITLNLTDRFDLQIGGRESRFEDTGSLTTGGLLYDAVTTTGSSRSNAFTYLLTPQFKISPDLMLYARFASGYRAGGPNTVPGEPAQYKPDKTQNYEIGAKGSFLDRRVSFDASLYYIDWKDIQVLLFNSDTFETWTVNANRAKSQGVELSVDTHPLQGLTVGAWGAFDDAKLTSDFPTDSLTYGIAGDRLPYTSRWSGNLSAQQDFPVGAGVTGFVGGLMSYVGARQGTFTATPDRQSFPSYVRTDLRAGAKYGTLSANLSVINLSDKRAPTLGGVGSFPPYAFNYIQPRTIGLNVVKLF